MKIINYLMIIGLFVGMYKLSLFAAIPTNKQADSQSQQQQSIGQQQQTSRQRQSSSRASSVGSTGMQRQEPNLINAVAILNNYQKKRDDFIEELKTARSAYSVVNSKRIGNREMRALADKMKPVLDADERIFVTEVKQTPEDIKLLAARDNFVLSMQNAFENGTPNMNSEEVKSMIKYAQEYFVLKDVTIGDIKEIVRDVVGDHIDNDFERGEFAGKLIALIERSIKKKQEVSQAAKNKAIADANTLINGIDRVWIEQAGGYVGPNERWTDVVIGLTQFMSDNMTTENVRDFLASVKNGLRNKYEASGLDASQAQQEANNFITDVIAPNVPKKAIDALNAPQVQQEKPATSSWWSRSWFGSNKE
jgi:hypothetical protein